MKILIVDDVGAMRKIIRSALKSGGHEDVVEAVSGTDAMGKLDDIELILTDIYMPGMGGFSFVRALRENKAYQHLPIIAVSAENRVHMIERMLRSGVNDYIVKPFSAENLVKKVDSFRDRLRRQHDPGITVRSAIEHAHPGVAAQTLSSASPQR